VIGVLPSALAVLTIGARPTVELSRASLDLAPRQPAHVVVTLTDVRRRDGLPEGWIEGRVVVAVKVGRHSWRRTVVSDLIKRPTMAFGGPFDLGFADYNHDGRMDFNLGEPCGSNKLLLLAVHSRP